MDEQIISIKPADKAISMRGLAWLALAGAVLLWGTSYAAAKTALQQVTPGTLMGLRMMLASLVLLPFWSRLPRPVYRQGDWRWLLAVGLTVVPAITSACRPMYSRPSVKASSTVATRTRISVSPGWKLSGPLTASQVWVAVL